MNAHTVLPPPDYTIDSGRDRELGGVKTSGTCFRSPALFAPGRHAISTPLPMMNEELDDHRELNVSGASVADKSAKPRS